MSVSNTEIRQYYQRVTLDSAERHYQVNRKGGAYMGRLSTLEEALYYRDLYSETDSEEIPRPTEINLKDNNPYLENGLKYPVPERLQRPEHKPREPQGKIYKKTKSCYALHYGGKYVCCSRTYEQGYYILKKLKEYNGDTSKLPEIEKHYPEWYTWLLQFYAYIIIDPYSKRTPGVKRKYHISIPKEYLTPGKKMEVLRGYTNIEDALYERDFLVAHDWDYELLVEQIDDSQNPYYDMELPPLPQRRIRNVRLRNPHTQEIKKLQELVLAEPDMRISEAGRRLKTSHVNIRNWLRVYDINWLDFKTLVLKSENIFDRLEAKPIIYQPDLSPSKPARVGEYVYEIKGRANPWRVERQHVFYGSYPSKELALKIIDDLIACGWDKKQLKSIQLKYGYQSSRGSKNFIYRRSNSYSVRKTLDGKLVTFGCYKDYHLAEIVRDLLIANEWDKEQLTSIRELAGTIHRIEKEYNDNMFSGVRYEF